MNQIEIKPSGNQRTKNIVSAGQHGKVIKNTKNIRWTIDAMFTKYLGALTKKEPPIS